MRQIRLHCLVLLFGLILLPALSLAGNAKHERGQVMLVMDASGSMWGKISGRPKIAIARDVVRELMTNWDETLDLGLSAYGHRRKNDCGDIQTLRPVSKPKPGAVAKLVDQLNPKGKTPLSEAVKRAADSLKYEERQAIVILVSDGEETCNADPCAVGKALEAAGVDFTAHVVGFAIDKKKQAGLRCLAKQTGGSFFEASDAPSLLQALRGAIKQTEAIAGPNLRFRAALSASAKPLRREYLAWNIRWDFYRLDTNSADPRKKIATSSDAQVALDLPPGKYEAVLKWDIVQRHYPFEVIDGERREHLVNLDAGIAVFNAALSNANAPLSGQVGWSFHEPDNFGKPGKKFAYKSGNGRTIVAPAGKNIVVAKFGDATVSYPFELVSGQKATHQVSLEAGQVQLSAVGGDGTPAKGSQAWNIISRGSDGKAERAAFKVGSRPRFTLPAGDYEVQLAFQNSKFAKAFTVVAGKITNLELPVTQ